MVARPERHRPRTSIHAKSQERASKPPKQPRWPPRDRTVPAAPGLQMHSAQDGPHLAATTVSLSVLASLTRRLAASFAGFFESKASLRLLDSPNRGISCSLTPLHIGSTPRHSSQCQQNHQTQRESSHGNLMPSPPIPAAAPHRSAAARSFQIRRPGNAVAPRAGMGGVGAGLLLLLVLLLRAPSALHGTTGSFLPRSLLFAARVLAFRWHCEVLLGWLPHRRGGALALWSGGAGGDCARFRAASRRASWGLWYGAPFLSRASGAWNRGVTLASSRGLAFLVRDAEFSC